MTAWFPAKYNFVGYLTLQTVDASEINVYKNYLTSDSHTDTDLCAKFALLSKW